MGVEYKAVQWNRQKKIYDAVLIGLVAAYLVTFGALTKLLFPQVTDEIVLIRAFGTAAFLLLHLILCIGPLCRLNPKFLPLLYNRRHAGVTCFVLGLIHAILVILTYHAGSDTNPILSIFVSSPITRSVAGVPFQPFGFFALAILFLMASTSHDFWLANLTAPIWKTLHMLVYVAYALLLFHVTFGILQGEGSPLYVGAMALGLATVVGLHVIAGNKEERIDVEVGRVAPRAPNVGSSEDGARARRALPLDDYVNACAIADIPENRARMVCLSGERVAIFKYDGRISAVSNACQHQNGPSERERSLMVASLVRGMATSISRIPVHRRHPL